MNITDVFPNEIVSHIFGYLDSKSLSKAKAVCKSWNGAVAEIGKIWVVSLGSIAQHALSQESYPEFQKARAKLLKHLYTPLTLDNHNQGQYVLVQLHHQAILPSLLKLYLSEIPGMKELQISPALEELEKKQREIVNPNLIEIKEELLAGEIDITLRGLRYTSDHNFIEQPLIHYAFESNTFDGMHVFLALLGLQPEQIFTSEELINLLDFGHDVNSLWYFKDNQNEQFIRRDLLCQLISINTPPSIIRAILDRGADPNSSFTPLWSAVRFNRLDLAELLFDYGAKPDQCAKNKATALQLADWISLEMAKLLLSYGADPFFKDWSSEYSLS